MQTLTQFHNVDIDYQAMKTLAIENQPLVTEIPLSKLDFGRSNTILINGKTIPTSKNAYNQLLNNVLSVKPGFVNRYARATDETTKLAMLSTLKAGLALRDGININVIANKNTREITGFSSGKRYMNNEILIDLFEKVMNRYGALAFRDFSMDQSGLLTISSRTTRETAYLPGEEFLGGLTFKNSPESGTSISHNALRLICTNGMYGFSNIDMNFEKGKTALDKFFTELDVLSNSNFMAKSFEKQLLEKMESVASVAEVKYAETALKSFSEIKGEALRNYIPIDRMTDYLAKHKINIEKLTPTQMKNCPANINSWELINVMTEFGSHDHGYDAQYSNIQSMAGHLFSKKSDAKNFVIFYN